MTPGRGACLLFCIATACSVADEVAIGEAPSGDVVPAADSSTVPAPPPSPLMAGEGEVREYRLLLVNRLERPVRVFASARAGRVVLDTVPASDSTFVDLHVRADEVLLEAEDDAGHVVNSVSIELIQAALNRWEITLVPPKSGEYPRSQ